MAIPGCDAREAMECFARHRFRCARKPERYLREMPMNFKATGLAGLAAVMCAVPALAHHSFAMFDASKMVTLEGTVNEFQWTNPHAWILLMVADGEASP